MANVVCYVSNPTETAYEAITTATDVPPYSRVGPVTLSDAEVATMTAAHPTCGIICVTDATITAAEQEIIRVNTKILKLGRLPGAADS